MGTERRRVLLANGMIMPMKELKHPSDIQRLAIIDLGSNTARLIVMAAVPGYAYRLADQIREVVRLRKGMTPRGLSEEAVVRGFSALRLFKRFCDSAQVDMLLATATSAVREAPNGPAFIQRVEEELGLTLRILDGEQEAYYGVLSILNEIPMQAGFAVEIGGGSAQVSEVRAGRFYRGQSVTLGALALTERFVRHDPATKQEYAAVRAEIDAQLDTITWLEGKKAPLLAGVGGTIRNMARMEAARSEYPLNTLHGFKLTQDSVKESIALFRELPLKKRQRLAGMKSDRADIILPGAMVLLAVMQRLGVREMTVSAGGLREGVFYEQFWQHLPYPVIPDVRRFSVLNLARNYQYNKMHATHVRYLAGRVFDQLAPLHGYGPEARVALEAASILHDIGTIIGYDGHDRHGQTLIEYNGLPGFTPREIALVGLLIRYHRKGTPQTEGYKSVLRSGDKAMLVQLAAILRLAEFLERGRTGAIDDVILTWDDETLRFTLSADEYPMVEIWEAQRNAVPLLETAFNRRVLIDSMAAPLAAAVSMSVS